MSVAIQDEPHSRLGGVEQEALVADAHEDAGVDGARNLDDGGSGQFGTAVQAFDAPCDVSFPFDPFER